MSRFYNFQVSLATMGKGFNCLYIVQTNYIKMANKSDWWQRKVKNKTNSTAMLAIWPWRGKRHGKKEKDYSKNIVRSVLACVW